MNYFNSARNSSPLLLSCFNLVTLLTLSLFLNSCSLNGNGRNFTKDSEPRYAVWKQYSQARPTPDKIRVVSYNIMFGKKIDKAIKIFNENPELKNADVICLQEMNLAGVQKISKELKYNYIYYPAVTHPLTNQKFGNAVLSKWTIIDDRKIILPSTKAEKLQRVAVAANIMINEKEILVYSVHFDIFSRPAARRSTINRIFLAMPSMIQRTVVAGDFNTFTKQSRDAIIDQFLKAEFSLATKEAGWTHKQWYLLNKKSPVDHIFVRGLDIGNVGKVIDRSASDHIPVWVDLKL